jgi:hypothetical protein
MDPYLEKHWRDLHARLVHDACNAIQGQLASDLRARIDERLIVESPLDQTRAIHPDVRVFERGEAGRPATPTGGIALAEPLVIAIDEPVAQRFVQIIDLSTGGRVVTVIEFLSPSNKVPGMGRVKYRQKQQECRDADVNLVEIDLTRTGERDLLYPVANLPPDYQTPYLACVYRGFGSSRCEIYRMPLQSGCRRSGFRCAPPIATQCSTSRPSWTRRTGTGATTTSPTPSHSGRPSIPRTPPGRRLSCAPPASDSYQTMRRTRAGARVRRRGARGPGKGCRARDR